MIVEEDAEITQRVHRAMNGRFRFSLLRQVGRDGNAGPSFAPNQPDRFIQGLLAPACHGHPGSFPGEEQCRGPADAAARPGDEGRFPFQSAHVRVSPRPERPWRRITCRDTSVLLPLPGGPR